MTDPHAPGEVTSKRQNYALFDDALYGNKLQTWPSVDAFLKDYETGKFTGTASVRFKTVNNPLCRYDIPLSEIEAYARSCVKKGEKWEDMVVNESAPDDQIIVQGEFMNNPGSAAGWYFRHSFHKEKMRTALAVDERHAEGLRAHWLLKHYMSPSSWEDFCALLEKYPTSVFELSIYRVNVGHIPGRNTIIWEVRTSY